MKTYHKLFFTAAVVMLALASCKKQDYYQENPNKPSTSSPSLLFTNICINVFNPSRTELTSAAYASRQLTFYGGPNTNVNYGWTTAGFDNYDILRQVKDMSEKAAQTGETNYQAIAGFFRAVCFSQLTETFGDVPYSEAMKALDGITKPKYDAQQSIYVGILKELDDANNQLDASKGSLSGDIIYGNTPDPVVQWKKLINAFRLRLLIHLSKKESVAELNIKQQFNDIVSNPTKYPLMESNDDNGQIIYNTSATSNGYPTFQFLDLQTLASMEKGFVKLMKDRSDPRLFQVAEPISGETANDFNNYDGVDAGQSVSDQQSTSANASRIKKRYWSSQVNEPMIFLGYAEQEFLIAEAISRKWITGPGTAASHYNNGITASMNFYGISESDINKYLAEDNVIFTDANALSLIITQKYLSFFMNAGWEPFFEQRRTGIPAFSIGPATLNGGIVPKRWQYPTNEYTLNADNINAAVQSQYGGKDDINGVMWLLK